MTSRPDILLLVLDTQRVDRLSVYGYERGDLTQSGCAGRGRHALSARRFARAVDHPDAHVPVHRLLSRRAPYAAVLLQGARAGIPTLAELLREDGYYTAAFCNNPLVGVVDNGLRRGFYSFLNYSGLITNRAQPGRRAPAHHGPLSPVLQAPSLQLAAQAAGLLRPLRCAARVRVHAHHGARSGRLRSASRATRPSRSTTRPSSSLSASRRSQGPAQSSASST